ncbi:MAG: sialidase family protein [Enhygromyxa sp.]
MTDTLLVSTRKGLFEVRRHGSGWTVQRASFVGDNVTLALVDGLDGCWYAALDHGHFGAKLHRSEDDGESWVEVGVPEYPPKPADEDETSVDGKPVPWALQRIWALASAGADRPGELWAGTIPGGLFRSRDLGQTWSLVESLWRHPDRKRWFGGGADLPGIHSILVDPRDSRRVLVGVSCGGVWESTDDGETWTVRASGMRADFMPPEQVDDPVIQDPHRVVACPACFDQMWTQHHCGIWRSTDGARSWTEVKEAGPSTFGFAVAVHPREPETAYFVPAISDQHRVPVDGRVVVTRTRDGGRSFDVLRNGLPQNHAYDLVYRHALDIDRSGDLLALGSTTGNLWISEDGGDRFITVSAHLPPIYAVSFV